MNRITVLQLGKEDLRKNWEAPDYAAWFFEPDFSMLESTDSEFYKKDFDIAIIGREINEEEFVFISSHLRSYTLFVLGGTRIKENGYLSILNTQKCGERVTKKVLQERLTNELSDFYHGSYGEKFNNTEITINQGFNGQIKWYGYNSVNLDGDYGEKLSQIACWRTSIPIEPQQTIEFWLEYKKDDSVEIALEAISFYRGSISDICNKYYFPENNLSKIIKIKNENQTPVTLFLSIKAKGEGNLNIVSLHDRFSRNGKGTFLPGGERVVTSSKEEVFFYFDPGNMKPPLNVYFSGYKTQEGFEGYNMMRRLKHPFILISESRLEGGAFYLGDEEYENAIVKIINSCCESLGFKNSDVIMSGLSMGTFGAVYYGADIRPHAVIIGKPLVNLGDVACNERINRPGGFATSLDLLLKCNDSLSDASIEILNKRFWDKFEKTNWGKTKFVVSYMIEDDYDIKAYEDLQYHLKDAGTQIYGKGLHGRHNDDTNGIVSWFLSQYRRIISEFDN